MKKSIIFCFGLVFLLFISLNFVFAETIDKTPPVLNSISVVNKEFIGGQEVLLDIDAYDDVSGWSMLHIVFIESTDNTFTNDNNYQLTFHSQTTSGKYYSSSSVPVKQDVTYKIHYLSFEDNAKNSICYTYMDNNDSAVEGCNRTLDYFEINVKSDNKKQNLKSFSINKNEFNLNEKIKFEVELNDVNDIFSVQVNYLHENISTSIDNIILKQVDGTNKYVGELELQYVGRYDFTGVTIMYNNWTCESTVYESVNSPSGCNLYKNFENNKYDIIVNGEKIKDDEVPNFVSLEFEKNIIQAPGNIKFYVRTFDNVEVVGVAGAYTREEDFNKKEIPMSGFSCNKKENNLFECNIEFSQYSESGTFKIREIQVLDSSGNISSNYYGKLNYEIEYDKVEPFANALLVYRKLPEYTFKIEKNLNSDETSSTISNDLLDKINNSSDNAVISIDCTNDPVIKKEIFDAIKGTNKTISVETNGIQWIFSGKNIINNTKNINVSSTISLVDTNTSSDLLNKIFDKVSIININFHSNGLLPGIAKIRVKADYTFRNVVGTKNLFVFYLDESNGMIRYISKTLNMTDDGYYEFYIAHNSKYIIASKQPKEEYVNTTTLDQKIEKLNSSNISNGDSNNINNNNINNNNNNSNVNNDANRENDKVLEEDFLDIKEELENGNNEIITGESDNKSENVTVKKENNSRKNKKVSIIILVSLLFIIMFIIGLFIYKRKK